MAKSALQPYAELKVKVREYEGEDGKTKGVYQKVGTLFSSPHGSHMAVKIEAIPVTMFKDGEHHNWNGWCNVFKIESAEQEIETGNLKEAKDFEI